MNKKVITLSFDDGEDFDIEIIELLKMYRLAATRAGRSVVQALAFQ